MIFHKPKSLSECLCLLKKLNNPWLLAGGTDINIQLRQQQNIRENVVFINHLPELRGIKIDNKELVLGATTTIKEISDSELIRKHCPFLAESLAGFASPLISSLATLAGNIANSSPTADSVPLLLVLKAHLILSSTKGSRKVPLQDFYTGYKKFVLRSDEMITAIVIPLQPVDSYTARYIKVGSRKALTIAKLSLAFIRQKKEYRIAAGALSEYPKRLKHVEEFLHNNTDIDEQLLLQALKQDVTPISDFRSEKDYRLQVCLKYLLKFIKTI
jgi:CO/xanthine dehydrogenase FAD-binding subunit